MTHPTIPTTSVATFVVRFWCEASAGEGHWRGRIEHVPSGEGIAFLDAEGSSVSCGGLGSRSEPSRRTIRGTTRLERAGLCFVSTALRE